MDRISWMKPCWDHILAALVYSWSQHRLYCRCVRQIISHLYPSHTSLQPHALLLTLSLYYTRTPSCLELYSHPNTFLVALKVISTLPRQKIKSFFKYSSSPYKLSTYLKELATFMRLLLKQLDFYELYSLILTQYLCCCIKLEFIQMFYVLIDLYNITHICMKFTVQESLELSAIKTNKKAAS